MRVFVLSTGRCGTFTFYMACRHVRNYTSNHESRANMIGPERFSYPDDHIEIDNRLSWFLGVLEKKFGDDAYYVHLVRNKEDTVRSYNRRWDAGVSIMKAFSRGILKQGNQVLTDQQKTQLCSDYYDTVNANIQQFLQNKPHKMEVQLEQIRAQFGPFCQEINADCDYQKAIEEFGVKYNNSLISAERL